MAKLKPGALTIDLVDGSIHGDLDHCPRDDLLESAQAALLSLLPKVRHRGLWGLGKAYDADCYLHTEAGKYAPPEGLILEAECPVGSCQRYRLATLRGEREAYWRHTWYEKLVGSIKGGVVSHDIEGLTSRYREPEPIPPSQPARISRAGRRRPQAKADQQGRFF